MVNRELALDLELFTRGGQEILNAIERQGYDVLTSRPAISKPRKLWLVLRAAVGKMFVSGEDQSGIRCNFPPRTACAGTSPARQAKNFYYAFLVLPRRKRNALCAVYAFMRHADDISDDETVPAAARREKLTALMDGLHRAVRGEATDDPVSAGAGAHAESLRRADGLAGQAGCRAR